MTDLHDPSESPGSRDDTDREGIRPFRRGTRWDLKTWVDVAQLIGAMGVVLSLVYVANEFRRSQMLSSSQVEDILYSRVLELNRLLIENPDMATIISSARSSTPLASADSLRFLAYEHIYYDSWETAYDGFHDGILDEAAWIEWEDWFVREARNRPRAGWTANRANFTGEFGEYVDRLLPGGDGP